MESIFNDNSSADRMRTFATILPCRVHMILRKAMRNRTFFTVVLLCALAGWTLAQDQQAPASSSPAPEAGAAPAQAAPAPAASGSPQKGIDKRMQEVTERFRLTPEQQQQARPILEDAMQQARAIRHDATLTPQQKDDKIRELHQATHAKIQGLLTPAQQAMAGVGKSAPAHPQRMTAAQRCIAWLDQHVQLTDDQKAKLEPLFTDEQAKIRAIRQDASLAPPDQKAKIHAVRHATHKQVLALLTPAQRKMLQHPPARAAPPAPAPTGSGT
jgi:uncharacterized membrane protein